MGQGHPPPDSVVSRARLFRSVLAPLPSLALSFRFAGVEHPTLYACALHADEANEVLDSVESLEGIQRTEAIHLGLVARSLRVNGKQVFQSAQSVAELPDTELAPLQNAVIDALSRISPMRGWCNEPAWLEALTVGARDASNRTVVYALGGAYDVGGSRTIERPDRYFGRPLRELLDGHWLAYRAARAVFEERIK